MLRKVKRQYDKEFNQQTVRLYFEQGKFYKRLGEELVVPEGTLSGCVSSGKYVLGKSTKPIDAETMSELRQLRSKLM